MYVGIGNAGDDGLIVYERGDHPVSQRLLARDVPPASWEGITNHHVAIGKTTHWEVGCTALSLVCH